MRYTLVVTMFMAAAAALAEAPSVQYDTQTKTADVSFSIPIGEALKICENLGFMKNASNPTQTCNAQAITDEVCYAADEDEELPATTECLAMIANHIDVVLILGLQSARDQAGNARIDREATAPKEDGTRPLGDKPAGRR